MLERCQREFDAVCEDHFQVAGCTPSHDVLPWTNLAEACIDYMVTLLKTRIEDTESEFNHFCLQQIKETSNIFRWRKANLKRAKSRLDKVSKPKYHQGWNYCAPPTELGSPCMLTAPLRNHPMGPYFHATFGSLLGS